MKKTKRWLLGAGLTALLFTLSGCVATNKDGTPTGEGWVYNLLVEPISNFINYLVNHFHWSYGVAIIVITIIVRTIIMPLGLYQSKKSMIQTEKMAALKPQMDAIQEKLKNAQTQEEKMAANMEMQKLYKENGVSMMGGMGCLPLLIQMPIFTALFYAAKFTPGISESTFLGVNLGEPNLIFVILAGLSYLAQSLISMIGIPEEQKKTMRTMMFTSPLMIVFISLRSPAGVTLYWIAGGIFSCIQTLITNLYHKPKIKAAIAEELKNNPPKVMVSSPKSTIKKAEPVSNNTLNNSNNNGKRNAGKQQRR